MLSTMLEWVCAMNMKHNAIYDAKAAVWNEYAAQCNLRCQTGGCNDMLHSAIYDARGDHKFLMSTVLMHADNDHCGQKKVYK